MVRTKASPANDVEATALWSMIHGEGSYFRKSNKHPAVMTGSPFGGILRARGRDGKSQHTPSFPVTLSPVNVRD